MPDRRSNPRLRHAALPLVIFVVVTLATLAAASTLWRSANDRDRARFDAETRIASVAISERLERQIALLRGTAGLFAASAGVGARDFDEYVDRLSLASRYPGVLGIGYAPKVPAGEGRAAIVERLGETAATAFRIFPADTGTVAYPVLFLSPLDRRNRAAIGFDMASEPIRRAAMIRSESSGQPAASGRVLLVQDRDGEPQPGFLLYLPVYEGGRVPVTARARANLIEGFVYSPLRSRDLLRTVFPDEEVGSVDVAIYDDTVDASRLLFQTSALDRDASRFYEERSIEIAGRRWILATATSAEFSDDSQRNLAWWTASIGLATALFLAYAALAQGRAALATERARGDLRRLNETLETRVEERTLEVTTANAGLRQEIERRQGAEEQVRQMQKMEAVGQLTGGIAHDFNNMLAVVIGSLDMAKRRTADPARVERLIANAMEGATRAATLTQRLLAFSRRQPLSPEIVDVNRLVAGMSEVLRRTIGEAVQLETRLAGGLWPTVIDAGQLENAIVNLAVNARDAMPGGGALVIETANRRFDLETPDVDPLGGAGDYVVVTVADTGEGMTPDVMAKAFDPFFTTKEVGKGTGLGLSQVFGFIQQSGGRINIDSTPGTGTAIRISLPRSSSEGVVHPDDALVAASALRGGTSGEIVLVVEDEDQVRLMSVEALRDLGYTVLHADGGPQALDMLERYPGIRLLFTDVVMPEMNGRELAEAARVVAPDIRLLFTTGYARDAILTDGVVDPQIAFLPKPFTFEQLAAKVRAVLDADT